MISIAIKRTESIFKWLKNLTPIDAVVSKYGLWRRIDLLLNEDFSKLASVFFHIYIFYSGLCEQGRRAYRPIMNVS